MSCKTVMFLMLILFSVGSVSATDTNDVSYLFPNWEDIIYYDAIEENENFSNDDSDDSHDKGWGIDDSYDEEWDDSYDEEWDDSYDEEWVEWCNNHCFDRQNTQKQERYEVLHDPLDDYTDSDKKVLSIIDSYFTFQNKMIYSVKKIHYTITEALENLAERMANKGAWW